MSSSNLRIQSFENLYDGEKPDQSITNAYFEKLNSNKNQIVPMEHSEQNGLNHDKHECLHLDVDEFGEWLDAVVTDDVDRLQALFTHDNR